MIKIGVHNSINGGIINAADECIALKTNASQIFLHSPRIWDFSCVEREKAIEFKKKMKDAGVNFIAVHSSYLITPLSQNYKTSKKSLKLFKDEISCADIIKADAYVIHIRENRNKSISENISDFTDFFKNAGRFKTPILIENSASGLGSLLSNLSMFYEKLKGYGVGGFCLDTAHLFQSGYDIRKPEVMKKIADEIQDIKKINMIHMNDSKTNLSSHTDRHHHIGMGEIGVDGFKNFFSFYNFSKLPIILETPKKSLKDDIKNLTAAKKIINNAG